ncbi:amylo-alpha-1,6-glucosidase, partial [Leptolyngbya sp. FACHB-36]|uniref:amylo-alpha-1,6-glucosidase n=1 Tax=Leptolyngbya sp. FACHB-36 TaxID=2692808 RepID=UPI0019CB686C
GRLCCQGLMPNVVPDSGDDPVFQSIDCSLWWIEMLGLYVEATQDWDFLIEQYAVVKQIYKAFIAGTLHAIRIDASDGLITWDDDSVALTWMNTTIDGKPVTPRNGKPIEVNALWYSALSWASDWALKLAQLPSPYSVERLQNQANRYQQQAAQVRASLQRFWNPKRGYLFDRIKPDDRLDGTIRPNAVLALSLHHCAFSPEIAASVLQVASDRLLTPYGLRSLDPADSAYIGRCKGNPYQRDLAAHQGTVWSWLLGPFLRAWVRTHAEDNPPIDLQPLLTHFEEHVCLNAISELFDGDDPHQPQGCVASAIAIAELLRCWHLNPSKRP